MNEQDEQDEQKYLQVFISCENTQQGMALVQALLEERLVFGGPVFSGPSKFIWKDQITEQDYSFLITYTRNDLKKELTRVAERTSAEMVCMISFISFEANKALLAYLDAAFDGRKEKGKPTMMAARANNAFMKYDEIRVHTADSEGDLSRLHY
jgi:uncharacterized protein involved in tolerance to divalent cations